MSKPLFKESQHMNRIVLFFLTIPLALFFYGLYQQVILHIPFGDKPTSNTGLIAITVFYCFFLLFIYGMKLTTMIDSNGICVSYRPFFKERRYSYDILHSVRVEKYAPIKQYLGHGYRRGLDGSTAYTVAGSQALVLLFHDGSKVLIGTQRAKMAEKTISSLFPEA